MRSCAACIFSLLLLATAAQAELRVFELSNRPASEVRAVVAPVMGDDVSLSVDGFRLIARGDAADLDRLAGLIESIDKAAAPVIVEVRSGGERLNRRSGADVSGRIESDGDDVEARGRVRSYSTRRDGDTVTVQQVRGTAGSPVYINRRLEIPRKDVTVGRGRAGSIYREDTHYRRYSSGFYAVPQVSGDTVRVEIQVADDTMDGADGTRRRVVTTVTGALGAWLPLGGVSTERDSRGTGTTYTTRDREAENRQLWIRVRRAQ